MFRRIFAFALGLAAIGSCSAAQDKGLPPNQLGSFTLKEIQSESTSEGMKKTWQATSRTATKPAFTFQLEMLLKTPKGNSPLTFSKGAIVRQSGENGAQFLAEVAQAIEAEGAIPSESERLPRLDFDAAVLGYSLSRQTGSNVIGGAFTSRPSGDWIALKIFLADGEGEVFVNLNPVLGQGEFSTKDPEYGDVVIREFAKVFLP